MITEILIPDKALLSGAGMKFEKGIHVTSDIEISLYGISQLQYTTDAFQAIPSNKLGNEYYLAAYTITNPLPLEFAVVATEDNTELEFEFNELSKLNNRDPVFKQVLNKGDIYYFEYPVNDITGTKVISDKPVAVFSGNNCVYIPSNILACDHIVEQIPDVSRWGTDYLVAPLALRTAGDVFRVIARADNTKIYIDYSHERTLQAGEFYEFERTHPFRLQSSEPTLLMQYSKSQKADNTKTDPFMLVITPVNQYSNQYLISTPSGNFADSKGGKNFANIIIHKSGQSDLLLNDKTISNSHFKPLGTTDYVYAQLPIADAQHEFKAKTSFYLSVYGYAYHESYGYPGGAAYLADNTDELNDICSGELNVRNKPGKIQILWNKNTNADYKLTRSDRFSGNYVEIATLGSEHVTFLNKGVSNQKNYFYQLNIFDELGIPRCLSKRAVGYAPNYGKQYNLAPVVASSPPDSIKIKQTLSYPFVVSDPEGEPLVYEILTAPDATATIDTKGRLSWLPKNTGEYSFALQATDQKGAKALQEFTIKVYDPNTPPTIISSPVLLGETNKLYQYQVVATDIDGDVLKYAVRSVASHYGLEIEKNTGLISWKVPSIPQVSFPVEVTATDSHGTSTVQKFKIFINKALPPRFTSQPIRKGSTGQIYQYKVIAEDPEGAQVKYYLPYGAPAGMDIDAQTGELIWQKPITGNYTIVIRATDGVNSSEQRYQLIISEPKAVSLTITSPPLRTGKAGVRYRHQVVTENAANPSKYMINIKNNNLTNFTIDETTGLITWDYPAQGNYQIEVIVSDGKSIVKQNYTLIISANTAINTLPPKITSTPSMVHEVSTQYIYHIRARDPEGQRLTYNLSQGPSDAKIFGNGVLVWRNPVEGKHDIIIAVNDGKYTVKQKYLLTVVKQTANNQPPKITSSPQKTRILPNQPFEYQIVATDADNDPLIYFISSRSTHAPSNLSIDKKTGLVKFHGTDQLGNYPISVSVSDGRSVITQNFTIIVRKSNRPPYFKAFSGTSKLSIGDTFSYTFVATDPEGKTVSYFLDNDAPIGMTIEPTTGLVTWTNVPIGKRSFTVVATDGLNLTKTKVTLTVGAITSQKPKITSTPVINGRQGVSYTYQVVATDSNHNDILQYSLSQSPAGMTIDVHSGLIKWLPSATGVYPIEVAVSDGFNVIKQRYNLTIYTATNNQPPVITSTAPSTLMAGNMYRYQMTVTDKENDPLKYRLQANPSGMTISSSGLISWQTKQSDRGQYKVTALVSDGNYEVKQTIRLIVRENKPIDSKLIKGLNWIKSQKQKDGSIFSDKTLATPYQTTDESYRTAQLLNSPFNDVSVQQFLLDSKTFTTEEITRSVIYRLENNGNYNSGLSELQNRFNNAGYVSLPDEKSTSIIDTAYALLAQAKTQQNTAQIGKAIAYLLSKQHNDGSFYMPGNKTNYYVTSIVLRALWHYKDKYNIASATTRAKNYLAQQYNIGIRKHDWELAHGLLTLYEITPDKATLKSKVDILRRRQSNAGIWDNDIFSTALAIQAIYLFDQ